MNFIFQKLVAMVGVEKLFLMAWNALFPVLLAKAQKSEPKWDEATLLFVNDLVLMFTGKKKPNEGDAHPDISKPKAIEAVEMKMREVK